MKQGEQTAQDISYLGEVGSLSTCTGKAENYKRQEKSFKGTFGKHYPNRSVLVPTRISPETLGEAEANSRVQLQVEQLLRNVFDPVARVVKLRTGSVSIHPLVVDLGRRCRQVWMERM